MLNDEKPTQKLPYILFDIGGTSTRVGVSEDGQTINTSEIFKTPKDFDQGIAAIIATSKVLLKDTSARSAAGGVAGPLTRDKSGTVNAPHLPGWSGRPLKIELSTKLGCEVFLENDTAMAGLGEAVFGAAKNNNLVAYLTISTGVNGVRVINRTLEVSGAGTEIGHQIIDLDGSLRHADLESLIGGAALERRYGKRPQDITDPAVWETEAQILAYGINNVVMFWSPEIVVLGGSMMKRISMERVKAHLKNVLKWHPLIPEVVKSDLGDLGGLWGALQYLNTLEKK